MSIATAPADTFREIVVEAARGKLSTDFGPAPMLEWIEIGQLVVDGAYQRELSRGNWQAIRRIAAQFRWTRFSTVLVAPVEGGRFAIIDGQHRTHAAAMLGIAKVPCQIVQMDRAEQAASFAAVNGLVTKVTIWNLFRAALAAGDPDAVACAEAARAGGCTLMTSNNTAENKQAGEIYAIRLIQRMVKAGHAPILSHGLAAIRASEFGKTPEAYANECLRPVLEALCARSWLRPIAVARLADALDTVDVYEHVDRAKDFVKVKRRQGVTDISHYELASAYVGSALDEIFPQRMALPGKVAAE